MTVRVTLPDGKVVEGDPDEAAAFVRALTAGSAATLGPREETNDEPPSPEEIAAYLESLPGHRHSMTNIVVHFAGHTIDSRSGDQQNPLYRRWIDASNKARGIIEQKTGRRFDVEQDGRKRTYFLK